MSGFRLVMELPATGHVRELHEETPAEMRTRIVDMIARLVDMLDDIDGDGDLEDDGNAEPALGWSSTMAHGTADDGEEDTAPTLGANVVQFTPPRRTA